MTKKERTYTEYDIRHKTRQAFKEGKRDMLAKFRVYLTQEENRVSKED
jgi:hypothetical protein